MDARHSLAHAVLNCKPLLARYLAGFTDENRTRQAPGLPNHVAWSLGHCALTMHRVAAELDGKPLPESDIASGRSGSAARYAIETIAFGSSPVDEPALYPSLARCIAIYEAACDRLAGAIRDSSEEQLTRTIKWGAAELPLEAMISRMIFHNGMHTGQIADLRRGLGLKSIFA